MTAGARASPGGQRRYLWTRAAGASVRALGQVFQGLSTIVGIAGFGAALQGGFVGGALFALIVVPVAVGLHWLATKTTQSGRRMMARSADQLMTVDPRDPVVYLRSFSADEIAAGADFVEAFGGLRFGTTTHEERLRNMLNRVGPVVALAEPGKTSRDLGAARIREADGTWMSTIAELFERASLIVMRAGTSDGLLWELEYLLQHASPERLVILVPDDAEYRTFRDTTADRFPVALPGLPEDKEADRKKNKAPASRRPDLAWIVRFESNWEPRVEKITALRKALESVCERLDIEPRLPPVIRRAKLLSALIILLGIVGALGVVILVLVLLNSVM